MTIEIDSQGSLPPLRPRKEPLITVTEILAVDTIHLTAGDVPTKTLCAFYVAILGFAIDPPGSADLAFKFDKFRIELVHASPAALEPATPLSSPGRLMLLIRQFDTAMRVLSDQKIPYDLLHYDLGLARAATLFDPAGNFVMLIEARSL